ncbi:MAG: T9SS C-terminal target domain-containing protein [Bacteroidetes bacterium]|nr:MAG: T9SS C-terminal target domain-containing protein [Bacteroidota bacterium]
MKTISFTTIFILCLFGNVSLGQEAYKPVLEPGKEWKRGISVGMGNLNPVQWIVTCDTLEYNGKQYSLIEANEPFISYTENYCSVPLVAREDTSERKLYYLPWPYDGEEEVLYIDYNLEQGDSVFIYQYPVVVDTVRYLNWSGEMLRFIDFGCPPCDGFVEGYGLVMSGALPWCNGYSLFGHLEYFDCDEINGVEEPVFNDLYLIYPNPAGEYVNIKLNDQLVQYPVDLEIRSVNGGLLRKSILSKDFSVLDMEGFPKGILILKLAFNGKVYVEKVVKY